MNKGHAGPSERPPTGLLGWVKKQIADGTFKLLTDAELREIQREPLLAPKPWPADPKLAGFFDTDQHGHSLAPVPYHVQCEMARYTVALAQSRSPHWARDVAIVCLRHLYVTHEPELLTQNRDEVFGLKGRKSREVAFIGSMLNEWEEMAGMRLRRITLRAIAAKLSRWFPDRHRQPDKALERSRDWRRRWAAGELHRLPQNEKRRPPSPRQRALANKQKRLKRKGATLNIAWCEQKNSQARTAGFAKKRRPRGGRSRKL